jgi:hypothetical protein
MNTKLFGTNGTADNGVDYWLGAVHCADFNRSVGNCDINIFMNNNHLSNRGLWVSTGVEIFWQVTFTTSQTLGASYTNMILGLNLAYE